MHPSTRVMMRNVAALVLTAAEIDGPMLLGPAYMAFAQNGMTMDEWNSMLSIVVASGMGKATSETLILTQVGMNMARKINEAIAEGRTGTPA